MSNYKLSNDDRNEFEEWWSDTHCEGDDEHDEAYAWSKDAFRYGIQYGKAMVTLDPREQDSYEETIREITRVNMELRQENAELEVSRETMQEQIDSLSELAASRGEALTNMRKQQAILPDKLENEITVLREQKEGLVLAVTALSDVLAQEVL